MFLVTLPTTPPTSSTQTNSDSGTQLMSAPNSQENKSIAPLETQSQIPTSQTNNIETAVGNTSDLKTLTPTVSLAPNSITPIHSSNGNIASTPVLFPQLKSRLNVKDFPHAYAIISTFIKQEALAGDPRACSLVKAEAENGSVEAKELMDALTKKGYPAPASIPHPKDKISEKAKLKAQAYAALDSLTETYEFYDSIKKLDPVIPDKKKLAELKYLRIVIKSLADFGNPHAKFSYGFACEFGKGGVPLDSKTALKYYKEADKLGDASAKNALGIAYLEKRLGLKQNVPVAFMLLKEASALNSTEAKQNLALLISGAYGPQQKNFI